MNYFDLFNLPFDYNIDVAELSSKYRDLQRAVHPDKFANAPERDRLYAVQKTAEINDAFQTLKHPLKRAEYMLAEKGVDIRGEQQTIQDPEFLMEQMELREHLEDIPHSDDPEDAIFDFDNEIKTTIRHYTDELKPLLTATCELKLADAANWVRKLKFMYKLRDELTRLEDKLLDD
ncbi:co-chaperone HscB [Flocculibacter collagenilyticus]|uniref:co-chaperone HscB n=1 Tax=Flocculibacter collagenilyticus TaxID=2744479 RepID=UPI0018F493C0|nr:co-chaperone HscB [Flocculibacter collagenilyticus]